jgi:hypothetical protein
MPIFAFSEIVTVRSGNYIEVMNLDKNNHVQARMYEKYEKNGQLWKGDVSKRLKMGLPVGQMSKNTLPVVLQHTVDKKSVMRGLLTNARKGGTLLGKTTWQGIAFGLVVDALFDEANKIRFQYNQDLQDFVTTDRYGIFIHFRGQDKQVGGISAEQFSIGVQTYANKVTSACQSYVPIVAELHGAASAKMYDITANGKPISQATGNPNITCYFEADNGGMEMAFGYVREVAQRPITQSEFDDIMIPIADGGPSEYVNASRPSQNAAPPSFGYVGVTATSGASVETDTYTDPRDGKAKETKVTINADGKTVTIKDTLRPDLQGDTEAAPVPVPLPDAGTGGETTPETEQTPFCELYPDVLACQKMGDGSEAESIFSDIKIPEITNPAEFKLDNFLPVNGSCPAPKTYSTSHGSIIYSYEKHCDVARTLRPFLIAFASVTALYLIFFRKA